MLAGIGLQRHDTRALTIRPRRASKLAHVLHKDIRNGTPFAEDHSMNPEHDCNLLRLTNRHTKPGNPPLKETAP